MNKKIKIKERKNWLIIKNKILKNTLKLSIICCGLLFSCVGYKKTAQFDKSLYDDESSESLANEDTKTYDTVSQNLIFKNTLQYENAIYEPSIKSVQLHPLRFELGNPLIHLSFKDSLLLSFDDLSNDPQNYAYSLIHCDANWKPSNLMENEYLEGFYEEPITDYQFSFNTTQNYVHYQTVIPSANLKPTFLKLPTYCFSRKSKRPAYP